MKRIIPILTGAFLSATLPVSAQDHDKESIKDQCGCYAVDFDYVETFVYEDGYERHEPYHARASAEWIFVDEENDDKIVIQHILVVNDSIIVKHWRQDWLFENVDLHSYLGGATWKFEELSASEVEGQWTQKVYQVDDSPRYQGSATWIHADGRNYWENTTYAPLPRREFSNRSDYDVMLRTNRHEITSDGFDHVQNNVKIKFEEGEETPLVSEAGLNRYTRINDSECELAREWWENNKRYWRVVRNSWNDILTPETDIEIAVKEDQPKLWKALFDLGDQLQSESDEQKIREAVDQLLTQYVHSTPSLSASSK